MGFQINNFNWMHSNHVSWIDVGSIPFLSFGDKFLGVAYQPRSSSTWPSNNRSKKDARNTAEPCLATGFFGGEATSWVLGKWQLKTIILNQSAAKSWLFTFTEHFSRLISSLRHGAGEQEVQTPELSAPRAQVANDHEHSLYTWAMQMLDYTDIDVSLDAFGNDLRT